MRGIARITTVSVLVLLLGLHWALLQTIAWTGMVINYSRDSSLREALSKTFDGKHPCPLCKAIKKGRAEEQKRERQVTPSFKLDLAVVWQPGDFQFACEHELVPTSGLNAPTRCDAPPKPRPRPASPAIQI